MKEPQTITRTGNYDACVNCGHIPTAHDVDTGDCVFEPGSTYKHHMPEAYPWRVIRGIWEML